jgi:hypothetical protein
VGKTEADNPEMVGEIQVKYWYWLMPEHESPKVFAPQSTTGPGKTRESKGMHLASLAQRSGNPAPLPLSCRDQRPAGLDTSCFFTQIDAGTTGTRLVPVGTVNNDNSDCPDCEFLK